MDESTLRLYIAEAEVALHRLHTGQSVVEVRDSSGESVRYTVSNASRLRQYILELKQQLNLLLSGGTAARGPMRPVFL